jgi:3-oxoacyl-[acyl-carrier protein] reductase
MKEATQKGRSVRLDGKVAVVTGGSRGIGYSIAEALIAEGASVVITGRDTAALEGAVSKLGRQAHGERADVREPAQAARAIAQAVDRFGGLDVLINNAGVGVFAPVAEMTADQWRHVIDTNMGGVFFCTHAALPHLRNRGGGWVINISSLAAKNPFVGGAAYCASKAGLNAFTEALMQEVRYDNIRVSSVMPGSVATGFGGRGPAGQEDWKIAPEDVAEIVVDLLVHPVRSLPSRVELRPSRPRK